MMSLPIWLPGLMFLLGVSVPGPMFLRGSLSRGSLSRGSLSGGLCLGESLSRGVFVWGESL